MSLFIFCLSIALLLIITLIQYKKKSITAREKGEIGEKKVQKAFFKGLNKEYDIFNNITVRDKYHHTTQIDHIILSRYGVFVLEVKNYSGWIYAYEHKKNWIQRFPTKQIEFQNPLFQNHRHINVLKFILDSTELSHSIHSVVIFSPNSTFKTSLPEQVFQGNQWISYIKSFKDVVLTEKQMKYIKNQILDHQLPRSEQTNDLHIKSIQKRLNEHS